MLRPVERKTFFVIFCIVLGIGVCLELYLGFMIFDKGLTLTRGSMALLNGFICVQTGKVFLTVMKKALLEPNDLISYTKLYRFASDRCRIAIDNGDAGSTDDYSKRLHLITETLRFAEESLQNWASGDHFELCVFVDPQEPLLFAYFDSNRSTVSKSMGAREKDPRWYIENNYEVVKILNKPSSKPSIIASTADKKMNYTFVSSQQKSQVLSTMLWCVDVKTPCVLVISSDAKNAFRKSDPEIEAFIKFIGNLVKYDLFEDRFIDKLRNLRPTLFTETNQ